MENVEDLCRSVFAWAQAGDFSAIRERFSPRLRGLVTVQGLEASWRAESEPLGRVISVGQPSLGPAQAGDASTVMAECETGTLTLVARVDADGWLVGLDLRSHREPLSHTDFAEEEVRIGKDPWASPGTLTIPRSSGPHPALVLVHGSGPNDRDETLGPNKPFLDLAWGMAARGIAVLRYEKRTKQYPRQVMEAGETFTVFEETVADALEAIAFLAHDRRMNGDAIFSLGHSMGGYLMPRIAASAPDLRGIILWAASFRPLHTLMVEQIDYIETLPETSDETRQALTSMREQACLIPAVVDDLESQVAPLGVPAGYWRDLAQYDPGVALQRIDVPALVMQGEADYQVTMADFRLWQGAANSRSDVTFRHYPHLNHCLSWTDSEKATPSTYTIPGHVAPEVIGDIADWILRGAGTSDGSSSS